MDVILDVHDVVFVLPSSGLIDGSCFPRTADCRAFSQFSAPMSTASPLSTLAADFSQLCGRLGFFPYGCGEF